MRVMDRSLRILLPLILFGMALLHPSRAAAAMEWVDLSQDAKAEEAHCWDACDAGAFSFEPYGHDKVPAGFQKTILFKMQLPPSLSAGDVLYFPNGLETLAVYIRGQKRYQNGEFNRSLMQAAIKSGDKIRAELIETSMQTVGFAPRRGRRLDADESGFRGQTLSSCAP